jgi:hypothetical protein
MPSTYSTTLTPEARRALEAGDIEALLAFHRQNFVGYRMEDTGGSSGGDSGGDQGGSGGTDQGGSGGTDQGGSGSDQGGSGGSDSGFPANTPVAEMTTTQQLAYYKHQNRKAETRAAAYHQAVGGKTPEEVRADAEKWAELERQAMSEQDRKIAETKDQTRQETARTVGASAARTVLELALKSSSPDMPTTERDELLDTLDLTKVLKDSGELDADKVQRLAERIAPAGRAGSSTRRPDYGAGDRGSSRPQQSGVAAGQALFEERRKKTTPATS